MKLGIGRQDDGSYILQFEQGSIRAEIAITQQDYDNFILELQMARSH